MRSLLFTILVSFNLVACVTGDNAEDIDMPVGEITAGSQEDVIDGDVSDEDAQVRSDKERPTPSAAQAIEQAPSAKQQTATVGGEPAIEQTLEKRPVRDGRDVPETNGQLEQTVREVPSTGGQLEQDGQLPRLVEDTALETLSDEELMQLELEGRILPAKHQGVEIDADLPGMR